MRKPISKKLRFEVFQRDGFKCQYCGRAAPDVVIECDHEIPVHLGGSNDDWNLVTACVDCNAGKGARTLNTTNIGMTQTRFEDLLWTIEKLGGTLKDVCLISNCSRDWADFETELQIHIGVMSNAVS